MARLLRPLDNNRLAKVLWRTGDNLPDCIKGQVEWRTDQPAGPGYYVLHPKNKRYYPVKFIKDHWYKLRVYTGNTHTTRDSQIPLYHNSTGYWDITDWQHPDNTSYKEELRIYYRLAAKEAYNQYPVRIETADKEAEEHSHQDPPTLQLNIKGVLSLTQDPSLSPFTALTGQTGPTESPLLTEPWQPRQQLSDSTLAYKEESPEGAEPTQQGQEDPVLEAQFEHVLDVQEREPEDPGEPDQPVFLHLVEFTAQQGFPIPAPLPLIQPAAIMAAAAPAINTGRLWDPAPNMFTGDHQSLELFKQQFRMYHRLNANHEVMQSPYLWTMLALTLIKGLLVDNWASNQVQALEEKVIQTINLISQDQEVLWTNFVTAFNSNYTDITKKQQALGVLYQLCMQKDRFNNYVATFKHYAK